MPNPIHYQVYGHGAPSLIFFVSAFARSSPGTLAVPGIAPWQQQIRNQAVIGGNYSGFSAMGLQPWRLLANQIGPPLTPHRNLVGEVAEINGGTGRSTRSCGCQARVAACVLAALGQRARGELAEAAQISGSSREGSISRLRNPARPPVSQRKMPRAVRS